MKAKFILQLIASFIPIASSVLSSLDADDTGSDDYAAGALEYVGQVIAAVNTQQPIPFPPVALTSGPKADTVETPV